MHARKTVHKKPAENVTLTELHKSWSPLDYMFYNHFKQIMEQTIVQQGGGFHQEVALFEKHMQRTSIFCSNVCKRMGNLTRGNATQLSLKTVLFDFEFFEGSPWDSAFNVSGVDCIMMALNPIVYRAAQRVHLFPENCWVNPKRDKSIEVDPVYCNDYFAYNLPWRILYKPSFVSECYIV